jgi:hypothetical protein
MELLTTRELGLTSSSSRANVKVNYFGRRWRVNSEFGKLLERPGWGSYCKCYLVFFGRREDATLRAKFIRPLTIGSADELHKVANSCLLNAYAARLRRTRLDRQLILTSIH